MRCKICTRDAGEKEFCPLHLKAYENIVNSFEVWHIALDISWKEYLREIAMNALTGEWTKEVTGYLIKTGETKNVIQS